MYYSEDLCWNWAFTISAQPMVIARGDAGSSSQHVGGLVRQPNTRDDIMTRRDKHSRRIVLKTLGAGVVGGGIITGSVAAKGQGRGPRNVVEIEAGHEHPDEEDDDPEWWLDIDRQEIPPGWVTFKFENLTDHLHFGYMVKVSEPALFDDEDAFVSPGLVDFEPDAGDPGQWGEKWRHAVNIPFQDAWDPYYAGDWPVGSVADLAPETFIGELVLPLETGSNIPDWFLAEGIAESVGGPGFTGGHQTATTTQYLDPGVYVLECYVLDEEGRFHSPFGMVEYIEVTDGAEKGSKPSADMEVSISSAEGITFDESDIKPGRHTVEVIFEDNIIYPNFLGHDIHLLRMDDVEMDQLEYWMDYLDAEDPLDPESEYMDRGALTSTHDNPGPETFLGGVQDVFAGDGPGFVEAGYPVSTYIDVTLEPGDHAWIAEVADPDGKDMLVEFTVTPPGRR